MLPSLFFHLLVASFGWMLQWQWLHWLFWNLPGTLNLCPNLSFLCQSESPCRHSNAGWIHLRMKDPFTALVSHPITQNHLRHHSSEAPVCILMHVKIEMNLSKQAVSWSEAFRWEALLIDVTVWVRRPGSPARPEKKVSSMQWAHSIYFTSIFSENKLRRMHFRSGSQKSSFESRVSKAGVSTEDVHNFDQSQGPKPASQVRSYTLQQTN